MIDGSVKMYMEEKSAQNGKKIKDLRGKVISSCEKGDLFPLVTQSDNSPGVFHIIEEIFQEYIKDDLPSFESAKTMQITCKDNQRLKNYADTIVLMYENHDEILKDIASVEGLMMKYHAKYILKKDHIQKNALISNIMDLKQRRIFTPLDDKILQKYPLIEANDVFLQESHGNVGFQRDEPDLIAQYLISDDKSISHDLIIRPSQVVKCKAVQETKKKEERIQIWDGVPSITKYVVKSKEHLLRVVPNQIIFTSFECGYVYKESIYIQNIGKNMARVQVLPFKESSNFKLQWTEKLGGIIVVAPGLSIVAKIEFHCNSLDDVNDNLVLKIEGGQDVFVPTLAKRRPPVLEAVEPESIWGPVLWSIEKKGVEATLECGVTLVGENIFHAINFINSGGEGCFWIMTEEEWIQCEIKNGSLDNVLKFCPFTLTPFYFCLKPNEEISLYILYEPKTYGLQIEHLKILCDNCVIQTIDILADAVHFESRFISFASLMKSFTVEVDDDIYADYYLNIGRILPNGCSQKSFFLTNESELEFQFHWKKRFIQFSDVHEYPPHTLLHVPLEYITVIPSEGKFSPNSDHHFIVKCMMQNGERGHYRAVLSFFVEDVPWQSIIRASNVRRVVVNPNNMERVDVLLNEIELWVECVPLAIMIQPCVIKITSGKLRCNDEPVLPKVTLANTTLDDIMFHWLPVTSPLAEPAAANTIDVLVKFGSIKTKTFMPCPIKITTLSHGLLLHEIRCSINEGERSVEMIVCAQVAEPQIYPSKYILNFGSIKKNILSNERFKIYNGSNTSVVWLAREFKYDFKSGALRLMTKCRLSADSGCFFHKDSVCTVDYNLDTKHSGIWISVIELSTVTLSRRYRQHFVLVVGDIQEPQLTLTAPPRFTAFLCPTDPLFVGIPVATNIILHNHSDIIGTFKWGVPLGQDIHKLKLDIKPRSGVIIPRDTTMLKILIIPLKLGDVSSFFIPCFVEKYTEPIVLGVRCRVKGISVTFTLPTVVVVGQDNSSEVHIPWSNKDKIEFPIEIKPPVEMEECKWPIDDQTDFYFNYFNKSPADEMIITTNQLKQENSENIVKNIEFEPCLTENVSKINDSKPRDEIDGENEDIIFDGKMGKLYTEEKCRLVLHFYLWENVDVMQTHLYENNFSINEKLIEDEEVKEEFFDIELPPPHIYPLAEEEAVLDRSISSDILSDTVIHNTPEDVKRDVNNKNNSPKCRTLQGNLIENEQSFKNNGGAYLSGTGESVSYTPPKTNIFSVANCSLDVTSVLEKDYCQEKKTRPRKKENSKEIGLQHSPPKCTTVKEIVLKNVKIKQIAATKFSIKNETPINALTEVSVINFPPNMYIKIKDVVESVFCETFYKEQDKMECCILKGNGVVVFIKQHSVNLKPYDALIVDLIVYANTWGTYYETIVCNILGLPPFYIKLTIEVIGPPVFFALAPPNILSQHPIKFGTMRYGSEPRIRSVKICNESCIDLTIIWHIFMKKQPLKKNKEWEVLPFSVVIDIYSVSNKKDREDQCQVTEGYPCTPCQRDEAENGEVIEINLVPYVGKEDYTFFEIFPKETMIESKSTQIIDLSFNPPNKYCLDDKTFFWAQLIGFIKVAPQDIYSKGRFYRPHGKSLQPVWAHLHAEVEMPSLSLETDEDDLEFFVEAAKIYSNSNKQYFLSRLIVVKNNFKSPITALVDTEKPFLVKGVNTMAQRNMKVISDDKEDIVFTLLPDECAEIHVSCSINEEYLIHVQEAFWYASDKECSKEDLARFCKKNAIIECPLQLVQPNIMEQTIKLKLVIEFPILTVSTQKIDFGPVFVGHTKWAMFEIDNQTVSHVWFYVSKVYQTNEFALKPTCGVLAPAPLHGRSALQIKVVFAPTENISYMDYLKIETCIPGDERVVVVEGVGTTDTKFETNF